MVPLPLDDVDTDQIMPQRYLKRIEREGFGEFVFANWREEGSFVLDDPRYHDARVLVTGANFGCGSSREHAVWGIKQFGFDAIVAPSFADIFRGNCARNGLIAAAIDEASCKRLIAAGEADPTAEVEIDIERGVVVGDGVEARFELSEQSRRMLLEGLDEIAVTLEIEPELKAFERTRPPWMPAVGSPDRRRGDEG
jgi:3-isopropylmalate/(R)-2-methylmalate dehydratase small subunit